MIIVIILIGALLIGGIGYLVGEPTPTLSSIEHSFHGVAVTNLQGEDKKDIRYFIGALAIFRVMLDLNPHMTWPEIKTMAQNTVPPTSEFIQLRYQVGVLIQQIWVKARKMARGQGKTAEDPDIKRQVLTAALDGLKAGAKEALQSDKPKVPPLTRR